MSENILYRMKKKSGDKLFQFAKAVHPELSSISGQNIAKNMSTAQMYNLIHNGNFRSTDGWFISPENNPKIQFDLVENFSPNTTTPAFKKVFKFTITQDVEQGEEIPIIENNKIFSGSYHEASILTYGFLAYKDPSYGDLEIRIELVPAPSTGLFYADFEINGGLDRYFTSYLASKFPQYGPALVFRPMIRLTVLGPVASGTSFYLCYVFAFDVTNKSPDIVQFNTITEGV